MSEWHGLNEFPIKNFWTKQSIGITHDKITISLLHSSSKQNVPHIKVIQFSVKQDNWIFQLNNSEITALSCLIWLNCWRSTIYSTMLKYISFIADTFHKSYWNTIKYKYELNWVPYKHCPVYISDVTWVSWHLISLATWLFVHWIIQSKIKENIKAQYCCFL